jgi:hypothetical protein
MARHARIGSIISGTLRSDDLLTAFAGELESLDAAGKYAGVVAAARSVRHESDEAHEVLGELEQALGEFAPPYAYFGSHRGDGADYGYWPDWDAIETDRRDATLPSADELPADGSGTPYFLHVSDHGNAELYEWDAKRRAWRSVWGVV